jgi:hypothetical protein
MADRISWTGGIAMTFSGFLRCFVAIGSDEVLTHQGMGDDILASHCQNLCIEGVTDS